MIPVLHAPVVYRVPYDAPKPATIRRLFINTKTGAVTGFDVLGQSFDLAWRCTVVPFVTVEPS